MHGIELRVPPVHIHVLKKLIICFGYNREVPYLCTGPVLKPLFFNDSYQVIHIIPNFIHIIFIYPAALNIGKDRPDG